MREQRFFAYGEIDIAEACGLRTDLLNTIGRTDADIAIDCTDVTFLDCSGIGVLLEAAAMVNSSGRHLRLMHLSQRARLPLDILDLTAILNVEDVPPGSGR